MPIWARVICPVDGTFLTVQPDGRIALYMTPTEVNDLCDAENSLPMPAVSYARSGITEQDLNPLLAVINAHAKFRDYDRLQTVAASSQRPPTLSLRVQHLRNLTDRLYSLMFFAPDNCPQAQAFVNEYIEGADAVPLPPFLLQPHASTTRGETSSRDRVRSAQRIADRMYLRSGGNMAGDNDAVIRAASPEDDSESDLGSESDSSLRDEQELYELERQLRSSDPAERQEAFKVLTARPDSEPTDWSPCLNLIELSVQASFIELKKSLSSSRKPRHTTSVFSAQVRNRKRPHLDGHWTRLCQAANERWEAAQSLA